MRQERLPGDGNGRNPTNAINEIIAARNETISTLNFPFDHAKEWDGVGLVFAYNRGSNGNTGHHEKFVDRPLYIEKEEKNLSELKHPETKEYFLRNLAEYQQDSNVLAQVMGSINTRVEKDFGADHKITMSQIILHLTDPTKYPLKIKKDDQNYLNIELDTEFQFGFFADCINESILMGPIKINLT